jgi:ABC-2 type transport system permease protein
MNTVYIAVSLIEFKIIYGFEIVGNPFLALLVMLISIPSVYGLGFIFASLVMWAKETNSMVFLVRGIIMVFCGWMKNISNVIPVTYSINALRKVIAEGKNLSYIKNDLIFLIISGIILMFAGILAFNYTQKKVKELGSLGQY